MHIMEKKMLQENFGMVHVVSSDMNFIGRFEGVKSDLYSHKMVQLWAIESSI